MSKGRWEWRAGSWHYPYCNGPHGICTCEINVLLEDCTYPSKRLMPVEERIMYAERVHRRFLWWPLTLKGKRKWLCRAEIFQIFRTPPPLGIPGWWSDAAWAEDHVMENLAK